MKVLDALLVKACVPVSFVLVILWAHDNTDDKTAINFLFAYILTYSLWWVSIGHSSRSCDTLVGTVETYSSLTFIVGFVSIYKLMDGEQQKGFLADHAIPFMDLILVYKCIKYEISCVFYFLYKYAQYLQIPPCKVIALLLYLIIHAVILLMILDFFYTVAIASINMFLTENFYYTSTADLGIDFPKGYIVPFELEINHNYTAYIEKTYVQNNNKKMTLESSQFYKGSDLKYQPLRNVSVSRYHGEDIELPCNYEYGNSTTFETIWFKEGQPLLKNNRYTFSLNVTRSNDKDGKMQYSVDSKLRIQLLRDYDSGSYECVLLISETTEEIWYLHDLLKRKRIQKMFIISVFRIRILPQQTKIMYQTAGGFVVSSGYYYYHTFQNEDVSVEYTINDRPVSEVCDSSYSQVCSVGSKLFRVFQSQSIKDIDDRGLPIVYTQKMKDYNRYTAVILYCICNNGYGIHRLSFQRGVFLESRHVYRILEFQHPVVSIVLPQSRLSLFRYFDDQHLYRDIENLVLNGTELAVVETKIKELLNLIYANEEKVLSLANFVQILFSIISLIIFKVFLTVFTNLYFKWFIKIPIRRYFFQHALQNCKPLQLLPYEFNIVISHSETEHGFVSDVLVPFLENECHLKVCLPERDFHQGQSIYRLFADAFSKCRKIIVVLSQDYMNDTQCYSLQLEHLIMPMMYEERKGKNDVLFVKFDDKCRLPEPLRWNFDADVLSWTSETQTVLKLNRIRSWYYTGNI